jgi:hypothetical protein
MFFWLRLLNSVPRPKVTKNLLMVRQWQAVSGIYQNESPPIDPDQVQKEQ